MEYRNPWYYVVMACILALLVFLVGVFLWHWAKIVFWAALRQLACLAGVAHRSPDIHLPEWDEKTTRVHRRGPVKDHWWSMESYYVDLEYSVCRHKGCKAFKVIRMVKDV